MIGEIPCRKVTSGGEWLKLPHHHLITYEPQDYFPRRAKLGVHRAAYSKAGVVINVEPFRSFIGSGQPWMLQSSLMAVRINPYLSRFAAHEAHPTCRARNATSLDATSPVRQPCETCRSQLGLTSEAWMSIPARRFSFSRRLSIQDPGDISHVKVLDRSAQAINSWSPEHARSAYPAGYHEYRRNRPMGCTGYLISLL